MGWQALRVRTVNPGVQRRRGEEGPGATSGPHADLDFERVTLDIRIRFARDDDDGFITGLASRFAECDLPEWRTPEEIAKGTAAQLKTALARGNGERSAVFVAEVNGEPAGFAWVLLLEDFYTGAPIGKVSEIAATRSGSGTGQALMQQCEQWARERGAQLITLNALEGNVHARRFYERGGYAPEYTMYVKRLR